MAATRNDRDAANLALANSISPKRFAEMRFKDSADVVAIMKDIQDTHPDCLVKLISKGNNKNILLQKNDNSASVVIQISQFKAGADFAIKLMGQDNAAWLPAVYNRSVKTQGDRSVDADLNKFPIHDVMSFAVMEKCSGSLEGRSTELNEAGRHDEAVALAINVGQQVSALLDSLSKRDIIWTDVKPGNILLRENDGIVITDIKGFCPLNMLIVKDWGGKVVVDNDVASTRVFLSDDFVKKMGDMSPESDVKQAWAMEYSYQMSVLLYTVASGQQKLTNAFDDDHHANFDFNFDHPSFKTEQGARLKTVIEALSVNDPNMRMHHKDAAILLSVIADEKKFNEMYNHIDYAKLIEQQEFAGKVKALPVEAKNKSLFQRVFTNKEKSPAEEKQEPKPVFEGYLTKLVADTARATAATTSSTSTQPVSSSSTAEAEAPATKKQNRLSKSLSSRTILNVLHQGGPAPKKAAEAAPEVKQEEKQKMQRTKSGILQKLTGRDPEKTKEKGKEKEQEVEDRSGLGNRRP